MVPQAVLGLAFLKVTKLQFLPHPFSTSPCVLCAPRQEGRDGDFPVVCLACLQSFPQSYALAPQLPVPCWGGPILPQLWLCLTEADRKCLITILWPGFCCISQIVYVTCSAYLSWCYFIPAVSKRMTKIFMYSQLIVTCLWSVLAQKTNQPTNIFFQL